MSVYLGKDKINLVGGITIEGNTGTDTSDATALPSEIQEGKTAYVKGEKVTGTMKHMPLDYIAGIKYNKENRSFYWNIEYEEKVYADKNDIQEVTFFGNDFGEATADDVRRGVTFTSGNGLSLTGAMQQSTGGVDTSDATATASDILYNKTAYVKGRKVYGTMENLGHITDEIDGLYSSSLVLPSGYISGGTISLTDDIEYALRQI